MGYVISYVDDIFITAAMQHECLYHTQRVLQAIESTGFKINPEKTQLVQSIVLYLA